MTISEIPTPPDPVTALLVAMFRAFEVGWREAAGEPVEEAEARYWRASVAAARVGVTVHPRQADGWRRAGRERRLASLAGPLADDDPPPRGTQRYGWWVEEVLADPDTATTDRILSWGPQVAWDVMIAAARRSGVLGAQIEVGLGGRARRARVDALVARIMQIGWPPLGIPDRDGAAALLGTSERARARVLDELGVAQ